MRCCFPASGRVTHKASKEEAKNEQKLGYAASKKQVENLTPERKSRELLKASLTRWCFQATGAVTRKANKKEATNEQKLGYAASKKQVANLIPESKSKIITKSIGNKMMLSIKWKGNTYSKQTRSKTWAETGVRCLEEAGDESDFWKHVKPMIRSIDNKMMLSSNWSSNAQSKQKRSNK